MLQPMHSRMSSMRPSSILFGRNGSAIEGRAAPMKSSIAAADQAHHAVERGVAPDADHRLGGQALDAANVLFLVAFVGEARGPRIVLPRGQASRPRGPGSSASMPIMSSTSARLQARARPAARRRESAPAPRSGRRPRPSRPRSPRAAGGRGSRAQPPYSSLRSLVRRDRKCISKLRIVGGVDVDEVEAGALRAAHGIPMPAAQVADVLLVHAPRLHRLVRRRSRPAGAPGPWAPRACTGSGQFMPLYASSIPARLPCACTDSAIRASAGMSRSSQRRSSMNGRHVRARVDVDLLGADHGPAALGLHAAHGRQRGRIAVTHAVAVRHLEEAVARGDRTDGNRLEEDVVARVAMRVGRCR